MAACARRFSLHNTHIFDQAHIQITLKSGKRCQSCSKLSVNISRIYAIFYCIYLGPITEGPGVIEGPGETVPPIAWRRLGITSTFKGKDSWHCGIGLHTSSLYPLPSSRASSNPATSMQLLLVNVFDFLAISSFLYLIVVLRDLRRRRGLPYPPGPPSRPIIGNLLDFPKDMPWSAYTEMSKKHGMHPILGN